MGSNIITITFDYNGGNPSWQVNPDSLSVQQGQQDIFWQLQGADFPTTGGIVFKPGSNWPGSAPTRQNAGMYRADEVNDNPGPGKRKYGYTITAVYDEQTYSHDPEIVNEPPGPGPGEEPPKGKPKDRP